VVRRLREDRGFTQIDLAKRARMSQGYLAALERGLRTNPSLTMLHKLSKALDVPVTDLFG
jgi:transcriptional regulator with XRE-family HTH domain